LCELARNVAHHALDRVDHGCARLDGHASARELEGALAEEALLLLDVDLLGEALDVGTQLPPLAAAHATTSGRGRSRSFLRHLPAVASETWNSLTSSLGMTERGSRPSRRSHSRAPSRSARVPFCGLRTGCLT